MVLDHIPDDDEVFELADHHLDLFEAEEAYASTEIVYEAPDWLSVAEQDQMNAFLRDGAACILVVYMREGDPDDEEEE
jgi:hypothetical protein